MSLKSLTSSVLFLIAIFGISQKPAFAETVDRIVAVVNDETILLSEVEAFERKLQKGTIVDDLFGTDAKELLSSRDKLINHMINERVVDSEVKRKGLNVTIEQVEKEINKITKRNNITRDELIRTLRSEGTSFSEYQDFIKKRLERQAVIEQSVTSKVKISDEEIAAHYYSNNKGSGSKETYEYKIAHILFDTKNRTDKEQLERAKQVLNRIKEGESFEVLASRYSEDPNFSQGGLLGQFKTGEFLAEFERAVIGLPVGDVSGIVKTRYGYHILKLLEKNLVSDPALERQKESIRQVLYQNAFKKQFSFWLDQKRREAFVRINKP